jgi:hypothetical protein
MAKGGLAKQRFRDRQRHNRIVAQLETLKAGGVTEDQVRAAGTSAWREYGGQALANLEAQKAGQTPTAITTATVPGAAEAGEVFSQPTAAMQAAVDNAYQPAQMDTSAPPTQWWQRTNQNSQTKGSFNRAIDEMKSPFAGVTGSTGTGINIASGPMYVPGGLSADQRKAAQQVAKDAKPVVPQWLGGSVYVPGGLSQTQRDNIPLQWWQRTGQTPPGSTARTPQAPGTVTGRNVDPSTGIPDFPMLADLGNNPGGGGGYGYNWKKRRKGGGGGGRWYQPRPDYAYDNKGREPFVPSSGLASWSIG